MLLGINCVSSFNDLGANLDNYRKSGFDAVEVGLDSFPFILYGEVCEPWVAKVKEVLEDKDLRFSAHIGNIDIRIEDSLQEKVLFASIDVCQKLGMSPLTLHFERRSDSALTEVRFFNVHRRAAEYAKDRGVALRIENIEVETLEPVLEFIDSVDNDNLRMTLDLGHLYLAAAYFRFDYLEAVKRAVPYVGHLHCSDNFGRFEDTRITDRPFYDNLSYIHRFAFGRGDIHLPPLWGSLPYESVLPLLRDYDGIYLCEFYNHLFAPFLADIASAMRKKHPAWRQG